MNQITPAHQSWTPVVRADLPGSVLVGGPGAREAGVRVGVRPARTSGQLRGPFLVRRPKACPRVPFTPGAPLS